MIKGKGGTDLRDTLLVLATEENSPSYPARVLALEEKGFGLSILEAEDLAVATDEQLTLFQEKPICQQISLYVKFALAMVLIDRAAYKGLRSGRGISSNVLFGGGTKRTFPG